MAEHRKLFSLEEANALIPRLEPLLARMQRSYLRVSEILEGLGKGLAPQEIERRLQDHPEVRTLFADIEHCVKAIQETGAEFKGVELGLVDFPWLNGDQVAYLCWQYGEKEIRWWHGTEDGFSGRRPLAGAPAREMLN